MAIPTSENGWLPKKAESPQCQWVRIPGAPHVLLEILKGQPLILLPAFAADFHMHVEPLRDYDSCARTPTNKVSTSNHLNATGMDLNWNGEDEKTFRYGISGERAYPGGKLKRLEELLLWWEKIIFCGGYWSIQDWMHFQMGYDTYNNPRTADFIARKIRPDGFSTFMRGNTPVLSRTERYALAVIRVGQELGISPKGIMIALTVPPIESGWRILANSGIPASLDYAHDGVGHDHDSVGLFQQRQAWGPLSVTMDPAGSARLFFLGGRGGQRGLVKFPYNTDAKSPGQWAADVQQPATQYRYRYDLQWQAAQDLYNKLVNTSEDDDMTPAQEKMLREVHGALFNPIPSQSIYATPGEGSIWQLHELIKNGDAFLHQADVERMAIAGGRDEIHRVVMAAKGLGQVKSPAAVKRAELILARIEAENPKALEEYLTAQALRELKGEVE